MPPALPRAGARWDDEPPWPAFNLVVIWFVNTTWNSQRKTIWRSSQFTKECDGFPSGMAYVLRNITKNWTTKCIGWFMVSFRGQEIWCSLLLKKKKKRCVQFRFIVKGRPGDKPHFKFFYPPRMFWDNKKLSTLQCMSNVTMGPSLISILAPLGIWPGKGPGSVWPSFESCWYWWPLFLTFPHQ